MIICFPGTTSLRIDLNSFNFDTNCYREWYWNTYFWCFPKLFIVKFILNITNEHAQDYSCPGATFAFCSHGEMLPRQGGLPGVVQRVTRLSKLPWGNEKLMWTVTGVSPCTEAKLSTGSVSCPSPMSYPGIMWTGPWGGGGEARFRSEQKWLRRKPIPVERPVWTFLDVMLFLLRLFGILYRKVIGSCNKHSSRFLPRNTLKFLNLFCLR